MIENNGTWSTDLPGKNEKHFIDTRQQFIVFHEYAGFSKQGDSIEFVRKGDYELYVRKDFGMIRLCEDNCESVESDSSGKTINNYFAKY